MATEVLKTERIEIVDSEGRVRASLGMQQSSDGMLDNGPVLAMFSPSGKRLISLELLDIGDREGHTPGFVMRSENGEMNIDLSVGNGAAAITVRNTSSGFTMGGEHTGFIGTHGFAHERDGEMEAIREESERSGKGWSGGMNAPAK